jgi:Cu-Zn family superoxide dismutase
MKRFLVLNVVAACGLALAGCSGEREPGAVEKGETLSAPKVAAAAIALVDANGASRGSVSVSEGPNGVTLQIDATGLPEGIHGVHLHEKGRCDGPKFESAGAHLNPAGKQHGRDNPLGVHLGDLPNLAVLASGSGSTSLTVAGVTLAGTHPLGDADGTSLVIHAKADDYKTDPSGASGDRIACAVLAAPRV